MRPRLKKILYAVLVAVATALFLRWQVVEVYAMASDSMTPVVQRHAKMAVDKVSYRLHSPAPGDLAAFHEDGKVKVALVESVDEAAGIMTVVKPAAEPTTRTVRLDSAVGRVFIVTR